MGVKIYGRRPRLLNIKIDEKREINIIINFWFLKFRLFFTSSKIFIIIVFQNIWYREGLTQYQEGSTKNIGEIEIQFKDK